MLLGLLVHDRDHRDHPARRRISVQPSRELPRRNFIRANDPSESKTISRAFVLANSKADSTSIETTNTHTNSRTKPSIDVASFAQTDAIAYATTFVRTESAPHAVAYS